MLEEVATRSEPASATPAAPRAAERVLSPSDLQGFVERGYVVVKHCFSRELAAQSTAAACRRLHCRLEDRESWPVGRMRAPESQRLALSQFSPRAWAAACELIGGEERARTPCRWGDGFLINFGKDPSARYTPPGPEIAPEALWHKDGDFFRHFLDSPEQGLLVLALFSDVESGGGATQMACDSVGHVARFLAERPQGVLPLETPADDIVRQCRDFVEATGEVGDVYFMHPFTLHSWSINQSERARFLINPPVHLREPMRFDRPDPEDHSPVERAVLRALGQSSFAFRPTAPRQAIVPERIARDRKLWRQRAEDAAERTGTPA